MAEIRARQRKEAAMTRKKKGPSKKAKKKWALLKGRTFYPSTKALIKNELPRRNDPCPCGSGKKYKKCCMSDGGTDGES